MVGTVADMVKEPDEPDAGYRWMLRCGSQMDFPFEGRQVVGYMTDDFDDVIEQSQAALGQIARGDASGYKALYSRREDITLGNPFGGFARGWDQVVEQLERAASYYEDGKTTDFEMVMKAVTPELAYTVVIERIEAKVGGRAELAPVAVRVTCVYRREDGVWKLVHRHADPRVGRQTAESVLQT